MTYEFDDFVVDPAAFRLIKDRNQIHIEPKALQLLILLIERRNQLVTKQDLLSEIWPGVAVTENALTRAVAQLRKTLGDDAEAPRYVETVPTRGYRFIGALRTAQVTGAPARKPSRTKGILAAIITTIVILTLFATMQAMKVFLRNIDVQRNEGIDFSRPPLAARVVRASDRFEVSPSLSPDGRSVVYSADVGGTFHLFISTIDGQEERQLTRTAAGEAQPSWSPDGKSIAFTSMRKGGIWVVSAAGGEPSQLTNFGSRPSWSPDGSEIAFQSADDIEYGWNAYEALPPSTIWIVDVASKKTSQLTKEGAPPGGHAAPSWRADGKRLVFSSCEHERCCVTSVARDGSAMKRITSDPRRLASPLFSPDGRTIYVISSRYNESILLALPLDENGKPSGPPQRVRQSNPGVMQHVTLSRDGRRFAWSLVEEKSELFTLRTGSTGSPSRFTPNPNATFPTFSPDGAKVAYCAVAAGDDSGIWVANADGSNSKAVLVGPGLKQYLQWSKNDWDVFYSAWNQNERRPVVYRASLVTGQAAVAADLPNGASAPAMSPDGKTVAFNRTIAGVTSVWTSAIDGSSLKRLTDDAELARFPVWSPSGKHLIVQSRRDGSSIVILPEKRTVVTGGENWPHSWSADEQEILFAGRRDAVWNVWSANVASGKTTKLTNFTSMTTWVRTPGWSPDGKRIVFELGSPRGNIWISEPRVAQ